ncbi:hypothetical protein ACFQ7F_13130 [Streptomyces sp. NPDC056486]|uniref:hypothetical protein n=1 Tax=Streptomyces sp. NPDC056486 TaxID=3345835 RepID=UPI0036CD79FF
MPGAINPAHVLALADAYLLCGLGEHDDDTPHAGRFCVADEPDDNDLWLMWDDSGHAFIELPACLNCEFFDGHPGDHADDVTDPLGALLERHSSHFLRQVRERAYEDDYDDGYREYGDDD